MQGGTLRLHLPEVGMKSPQEIISELSAALKALSADSWQVSLAGVGEQTRPESTETLLETQQRARDEKRLKAQTAQAVRRTMMAFPDAEVVDVLEEDA